MKKLFFILSIPLILFSGCSSFLEVDPRASISDDNTIIDAQSANTALNGVYSALRSYYSINFQSIAYLSGDNIQWTGSQSQIQEFINHNVRAENATISSTWVGIYETINRANNVIAKVADLDAGAIGDSERSRILGEAYFIRGLTYFDLARVWGGVPLITSPTLNVDDNRGIPRSTQEQTYQQAISDWDIAEGLLSETTNRYQATRKTVWALKARYFLYRQDWQQALDYASRLIADVQNYELLAPYTAFFVNNVVGTRESVFEIYYNANELNPHRNQWQPQERGGTRQWAPNDTFVALVNNPEVGGSRSALVALDNQGRWYGNLYYRSPATDPTYVIRIAELYLIRAEAKANLGDSNGALTDLNEVRNRAGLADSQAEGQDAILLAIENERRLEFGLEAHRWFDLVRTGRAKAVLGITDDNRLLLPLPAEQLLLDDALEQNPGY
ncbi:RagB/SusD family nutrient uptake outer membrane protein [Olivibacter sitiensis]|uniref:RagB/SusD family nutrient uptake outer membrane protein n=1 Tax=Olivibacter sitiensis TaxID=376470 RepID=UPI000486537B|nr:RagB/SusD family nutrient uptake outer membrane protein [Olivibacter sitiensis]